jgi:hypothetical protein
MRSANARSDLSRSPLALQSPPFPVFIFLLPIFCWLFHWSNFIVYFPLVSSSSGSFLLKLLTFVFLQV